MSAAPGPQGDRAGDLNVPRAPEGLKRLDPSQVSLPADYNPLSFLYDIRKVPCFRSSLMWGIGLGGAMGAHAAFKDREMLRPSQPSRLRLRAIKRATNWSVRGFLLVSAVSWVVCRVRSVRRREMMKWVMENQPRLEKGDDGGAAAAGGAAVK